MLILKDIKKQYVTEALVQDALNGVSLNFRDCEFVSVLGQSGSGKTTLLNIVGGLDRYDSGDLIINGTSTKEYRDRDWDSYRNHTVGFVFQSYNLIPHQTVLSNVELALSISGVSSEECKRRAKDALRQVGLEEHMHKKPNQLSGGQMQRVAIARALVNNPSILLADEPTGALDSETSVQVMELLKEVAKNRLVIMVTHNPELAEKYSSRIINLHDGSITGDSNPYEISEADAEVHSKKNMGKSSMSFLTSLSLSFNNIKTKKGRTFMTSFAGSIGIIGIAAILALSTGVNNYISDVQMKAMSSNPITLQSQSVDLTEFFNKSSQDERQIEHDNDAVYPNSRNFGMASAFAGGVATNDLAKFKEYLDDETSEIHKYIGENGIQYEYPVNFNLMTYDPDGVFINCDGSTLIDNKTASSVLGSIGKGMYANEVSCTKLFVNEEADGTFTIPKSITDNHDLVYGEYPKDSSGFLLVLDDFNEINAEYLYQMGLYPCKEYRENILRMEEGETAQYSNPNVSYKDICDKTYYLVPDCDTFEYDDNDCYTSVADDISKMEEIAKSSFEVHITGIIKPKEGCEDYSLGNYLYYVSTLTDFLNEYIETNTLVQQQKESTDKSVLTGLAFKSDDEDEQIDAASEYIMSITTEERVAIYEELMQALVMEGNLRAEEVKSEAEFVNATPEEDAEIPPDMIDNSDESDPMLEGLLSPDEIIGALASGEDLSQSEVSSSQEMITPSEDEYISLESMPEIRQMERMGAAIWHYAEIKDPEIMKWVYENCMSLSTYEETLQTLGLIDLSKPTQINLYADNFEDKDLITACIDDYNSKVDDEYKIAYTDYMKLIMSSVTTIVNVITWVLIAFVAVSLIVSSIMIGIITFISVLERTKEIGILRAIGASKKNISQVFNAETLIIGLCSGIIGVLLTELLLIPTNLIIHNVIGVDGVNATLPAVSAIILILLSMLLTFIGGLIPAKKAAKKDPVLALRSE